MKEKEIDLISEVDEDDMFMITPRRNPVTSARPTHYTSLRKNLRETSPMMRVNKLSP